MLVNCLAKNIKALQRTSALTQGHSPIGCADDLEITKVRHRETYLSSWCFKATAKPANGVEVSLTVRGLRECGGVM